MDEAADNTATERTSIAEGITDTLRQIPFLRVMLMLAATVVVLVGIRLAAPILNPILFAVVLTLLFNPIYSWLKRRGLPAAAGLADHARRDNGSRASGLVSILGVSITRFSERLGFYTAQLNGELVNLDAMLERLGLSNVDVRDVVKPSALAECSRRGPLRRSRAS